MNFSLIFITIIFNLFIHNQGNDNLEFNGIYNIYSILNNYVLIDQFYNLQFFDSRIKNGQMFRFIKTEKNSFIIESKKSNIKLGVNQNGHILMAYNPNDKIFKDTLEWNIIEIGENEYVVQNIGNKNFMEINNNFFQCINNLPLPIKDHKSEISNSYKFSFVKLF